MPPVRLLLPLLVPIAILLGPVPAKAQQVLAIEQNATSQYGESLTFSANVSSTVVLSSAELVLQVRNRASSVTFPVAIESGTDVIASTVVSVASLELPPAAEVEYQWVFRDNTGQSLSGDVTVYRYEDTSVPWNWEPLSQDTITILSADGDQALRGTVLELAANARRTSASLLSANENVPITVYVYPTLASLAASLRAHGRVVQDWVAAYAIPDQGIIFVAATPGPEMIDGLRRDISHEIMHLLVYNYAGDHYDNVPGWFSEGLALNTAPLEDTAITGVLAEALQNRVLLSTQALCISSFAKLDPHDAALAYAQSANFVAYIAERYGPSQISALVDAYANGLNCSDGVQLALGVSLNDLEQQWLRSLSVISGQSASQNVSLIALAIVWLASVVISLLFLAPQPRSEADQPLFTTQPSLPRVPSNGETT